MGWDAIRNSFLMGDFLIIFPSRAIKGVEKGGNFWSGCVLRKWRTHIKREKYPEKIPNEETNEESGLFSQLMFFMFIEKYVIL